MYAVDRRDGLSKEGSSRVAFFLETNHPRCFVLECNYNKGRQTNILFDEGGPANEEYKTEDNIYGELTSDRLISYELPFNRNTEVFDLEIFENTGKSICQSILDYVGINPISRLPNSPFKNLKVITIL